MVVKIGFNRYISHDNPCFIIAEIGSNHDGKLYQAKELIDAAKEAGADAVKFQVYYPELLTSMYRDVESARIGATPRSWLSELHDYCLIRDILLIGTPFDDNAVELLNQYVSAFKIASSDITDLHFISQIAYQDKPLILSTGMSNLGDIEVALRSICNDDIVLLHCCSLYPAPYSEVNLNAMATMREAFKLPVGFSDHTEGIHIAIAAVASGACVIEKHITIDKKLPGPDHAFAVIPREFREMVKQIREVEQAMGDGKKRCSKLEDAVKGNSRRSIHATVDIQKGEEITRNMLVSKRPSYGIAPKHMNEVVGRVAKRGIPENTWITWNAV